MALDYLPRSAWNARRPTGTKVLPSTGLHGVGLHYPGDGDLSLRSQDDVAHALRGWQDYHMDVRGWSDIAYQVAVDQAGRKWQLRGFLTESAANGNQAANLAYGAILLVIGDTEKPTDALISSAREVIADWRRIYPKATEIQPHSAIRLRYTGSGTSCPGDAVRALITARAFEPGSTPTPPPEDTMTPAQMTELKNYIEDRTQAYAEANNEYVRQLLSTTAKAMMAANANDEAATRAAVANLDKDLEAVAAKIPATPAQ